MPPGSADNEEIQRFEDQYRRNPDSLVFARLADACRKAGDPERALTLLRDGIQKHPDYPTAHLVRARSLVDLGRPAEAEESLRRVLELDAQNLVAMRDIAVLAEERGDPLEAVHWYEQIAALDPGNPEAAEALDRLNDSLPSTPPGLEPLPAPHEEWWSSPTLEINDDEAVEPAMYEVGEPDAPEAEVPQPPPEPDERQAPVELSADDLRPTWSDPDVVIEEGAAAELDALAAELDAGMEADRAVDEPAVDEPAVDEPDPDEGRARTTAWWFEDPADAEREDTDEDGDLLTRTMADLYVKQGLLEDAAAIYRELLADRPDDDDLRRALRDVEGQLAGPEASPADAEPAEEAAGQEAASVEPVASPEPAEPEAVESAEAASESEGSETAVERPESAELHEPVEPPEPVAAPEPYSSHPVPTAAGTSQVFRDWLRRLSE
jgi:tetratricopeptide (TPR) repeat protein